MIKRRLLLIDADPGTCLAIQSAFVGEFEVILDTGGPGLRDRVRLCKPHIVLMDINLPGIDGFRVLESLAPRSKGMPVFIISVRAGEEDILAAFRLGACDYLTKPFSLKILKARMARWLGDAPEPPDAMKIGSAKVDLTAGVVEASGRRTSLSKKETLVLQCLIANAGAVVTREKLLKFAWGYDYDGTSRTVDNVVASLRRKIGDDKDEQPLIRCQWGVGYVLERSAVNRDASNVGRH